jgi:16S rRNA (adenine1518-N6/adenine1519-N6)-dimethyltransferase
VDASPLGLKPKKAFGQNFLVNEGAIRGIVQAALVSKAPGILEIGPGPGVLTEKLLADGRPVHAIDLDPEAIELLQSKFADRPQFHLRQGDAVTAPLPEGGPFAVIGNLPYNAATPILTRLLVEGYPFERMVLMFQLEVGRKLLGGPSTKDYGPLAILSQLCCRLTKVMTLGPGSFRPAPKVDSAVLLFEPKAEAPSLVERRALLTLLHRAFAQRRKTLSNNLGDPERLRAFGLDPTLRAEAVPPATWLAFLRKTLEHS